MRKQILVSGAFLVGMLVPPAFSQGNGELYVPQSGPYVGFGYGQAKTDCGSSAFLQGLLHVPVGADGTPEMIAEDRSNVRVHFGDLLTSGGCAKEDAHQYYAGIDFEAEIGLKLLLGVEIGWIEFGDAKQPANYTARLTGRGLSRSPVTALGHDINTIYYGGRLGYRVFDNRVLLYLKLGLHSWEHQYGLTRRRFTESDLDQNGVPNNENPTTYAPIPQRSVVTDDVGYFYGFGVQYDIPNTAGVLGLRAEWQHFEFDAGTVDVSIDVFSIGANYKFNL